MFGQHGDETEKNAVLGIFSVRCSEAKRLHRSWSRDGWQKPKMINSSAVLDVAVPVEANVLHLARSPARIMFSLLIRIDDSYRPAPPA